MCLVVVYVALLLLFLASPDFSGRKTFLLCGDARVAAVYPELSPCTGDPRFKAAKCVCVRPTSPWAKWYAFAVVPSVAALLGYLLIQGTLAGRLLLLNGAAIAAFATESIRLIIQRGAVELYALSSAPISLLLFCASLSTAFLLLYFLHRALEAPGHAKR
jgi:hypothetical protein